MARCAYRRLKRAVGASIFVTMAYANAGTIMKIELAGRNAFADHEHVESVIVWEHAPVKSDPEVSIAIPTFRRPDLLVEAVASALSQDCDQSYEIVIVDNDLDCEVDRHLKDMVEAQDKVNLRYYKNRENIGMFGNWNRSIAVSRGAWITLLNDDDLLAPNFISRSVEALSRAGGGEGIVCRADSFDRRVGQDRRIGVAEERSSYEKFRTFLRFGRHGIARLTPRVLYFGNEAGNTAGFLVRRDAVVQVGGFLPEEWPAADYMLYVRLAITFRIFLFRPVLAYVGIGENESMRPETLTGFIVILESARRSLLGRHVPFWWGRFNPRLVSNHLLDVEQIWHTKLDRGEIEKTLAMNLPAADRHSFLIQRLLLRAY
jgi:glycosyltransferase involved in cell wall biosynthesis